MIGPVRLAIVATHPIQHFIPLYKALAETDGIVLRVLFGSRIGLQPYFDEEMNRVLSWNMDLLSGYDSQFLSQSDSPTASVGHGISSTAIGDALDDFQPDAVIMYGYTTPLARDAARIARSLGARTVLISDSELRQGRSIARRFVKALLVPWRLKRFDALLSVGDENERYYRHYGVSPGRIFRSPFPIDEASFSAARNDRDRHRRGLIERLGLEGNPLLVLFVGKLSPRKRPADLVTAVSRLEGHPRPIHAVFAGDGLLMDELRMPAARTDGRVHLLGFVNVDELPALYAGSDVVVHPSSVDPHPLICSEAACVGLPLILSDRVGAEGPTDIAQRGRNAFVFPLGDLDTLCAQLVTLADDPSLVNKMGRESVAIFETLDMRRSVTGILAALAAVGPKT